jgi:hypothetical protein
VRIEGTDVRPVGSSYATVIGNELDWRAMKRLLDASKLRWDAAAIFPALSPAGGPWSDAGAKAQLATVQQRVIADRTAINDGYFFDTLGRMLRIEAAGS